MATVKPSSRTVGFSMTDEDQAVLDELAAYFSGGNRSAYLRATFKIMKSIKLAEQLREIQALNSARAAELGLDDDERLRQAIQMSYKRRDAQE